MNLPKRVAGKDLESGQALVLLAAAFVGVAAFVGLTVDAGILFSHVGHLRRATDAASLAAANQFREGRTPTELSAMAFEYLELNGLSPSGVVAKVCDIGSVGSVYDDPSLCPGGTNPPSGPEADAPRKYVMVEAELPVNFAFLPIIGWESTTIRADSISEAASVDLVLVIDVSPSMAYDLCSDGLDNDGDGATDANDCTASAGGTAVVGTPENDVATCLAAVAVPPATVDDNKCHPFEEVRDSAHALIDRLYFPYDRISIVTFGRKADVRLELQDTDPPAPCGASPDPLTCAHSVVDSLDVELEPVPATDCTGWAPDPSGCTSTNIGDGLLYSGGRFCLDDVIVNDDCDRVEMREEAVWIVILITDGAANSGLANPGPPEVWICPTSTWAAPVGGGPPYCTDGDPSSRHASGDADYDADDYARDQADFVGCPDPSLPQPPGCSSTAPGGQGAVIFSIGLGDAVINYQKGGDVDQGEKLLRYIASVGDDGDPATDPCSSAAIGADCGNYYFSPTGSGLIQVFEAIASKIFTRLTH